MADIYHWCLGTTTEERRCARVICVSKRKGCHDHKSAGSERIKCTNEKYYNMFGKYPGEEIRSEESFDDLDDSFIEDTPSPDADQAPNEDFDTSLQSISVELSEDSDLASDDTLGGFSSESDANESNESSSESSSESSADVPVHNVRPVRSTRRNRQDPRRITIDITKPVDRASTRAADTDSRRLSTLIAELSSLNNDAAKLHTALAIYDRMNKHAGDTARDRNRTQRDLKNISAKMAVVIADIAALQKRIYPR